MKVPYANCDFADVRKRDYFYVDKTPFIPHIENTNENHLIFLRPRRIGKSTLISTLENYYDVALADKFDELFGGLWIHQGYCDLLLGLRGNASSNKYAWIIEAKYVKSNAKIADIDNAVQQGYEQIDKYAADKSLVQMLTLGKELKAGVLVFVGLKKVLFRAWPRPEEPAKLPKTTTKTTKTTKTPAKKKRA